MKNILITGATGNVGREVLRALNLLNPEYNIIAGVRNLPKAQKALKSLGDFEYRIFDFEDSTTFNESLFDIDLVFLLRPPHIADIDKFFYPLFSQMKGSKISKIVFLSVQGAEKSKVIPHNKIEKMINEFGFSYVFLRPSYFMQNLTTTLLNDTKKREIVLPAGTALFNWIDIADIGEVGANVLSEFEKYKGEIIELTGAENLSFGSVSESINKLLDLEMKYKSVNPISYFRIKKREGLSKDLILVTLFLHFLPRFQKAPEISNNIEIITGHLPTTLDDFILKSREVFFTEE